jgi:uncharacterized repeat protein (TIGR01451 family)
VTDLRITLQVPPTAAPGTTITVTATVVNLGPNPAQNVTTSVVLPNGSTQTLALAGGTLNPGNTVTEVVTYVVPPAQATTMTWTATVATTTPETTTTNNIALGTTGVIPVNNASLSGRVWFDVNRDRVFTPAGDQPLSGFTVELRSASGAVVGTATTNVNGEYTIANQIPGPGYSLRFLDPQNNVVRGTPFNQTATTPQGNTSTGTNQLFAAVPPTDTVPVSGTISNITLYAGDNVAQQNLPLDPNGVVYDAITRQPVAGATVRIVGPAGFDPATHLIGGAPAVQVITGPTGLYQFLFVNSPPSGTYTLQVTPPAGYANTPATLGGVTPPQVLSPVPPGLPTLVQPQSTAPQSGNSTLYYLTLGFNFPGSGEVINNHIPLDPVVFADVTTTVDLPTQAAPGSVISVTATFANSATASSTASAVVGTITLSNGQVQTVSVGTLPAGSSTVVVFTTTVPTTGSALNATSTVATSTAETNTANNIATDSLAVLSPATLIVTKTGNKTVAEVGDAVQYTIGVRNVSNTAAVAVVIDDRLPAGFRYIPGTARLNNQSIPDPSGGTTVGPLLSFPIGNLAGQANAQLTYSVRLGIGSEQGDGINRASARYTGGVSNTAQFKVNVQGGVLGNEGCIIGKVYVDCDGTHNQNNESGSRELGIPGVRLVMLDGSYVITDSEGKYSMCGVKPQTHVLKVDRTTLPRGSRMLPSSNRNAGVGDSIFIDLKGGEMHRADFIEGSCSPEVLDQVKARRAQGGVLAPETETIKPLEILNRRGTDGSPLQPQQILPAPRQNAPDAPSPGGVRQ